MAYFFVYPEQTCHLPVEADFTIDTPRSLGESPVAIAMIFRAVFLRTLTLGKRYPRAVR
jgi:hypothetical protein